LKIIFLAPSRKGAKKTEIIATENTEKNHVIPAPAEAGAGMTIVAEAFS